MTMWSSGVTLFSFFSCSDSDRPDSYRFSDCFKDLWKHSFLVLFRKESWNRDLSLSARTNNTQLDQSLEDTDQNQNSKYFDQMMSREADILVRKVNITLLNDTHVYCLKHDAVDEDGINFIRPYKMLLKKGEFKFTEYSLQL